MAFTPNDYVTVILSEHGADVLNKKAEKLNAAFEGKHNWRTDHHEGETLKRQFWAIMKDFEGCFAAGAPQPFTDLHLHPESA